MKQLNYSLVILLISVYTFSNAQTGWDYIKQNDNISAKAAFLNILKKDSTNKTAIQGMIYLCDVEDNDLDYDKYANQLLTHHFNNNYFQLFEQNSNWTGEHILKHKSLDNKFKLRYTLGKAFIFNRERKFKEYKETITSAINDFDWAYLGPFKNINGYGHIKKMLPEEDEFNLKKTYINRDKYSLKWLIPSLSYPIKTLDFDDYLLEDRHGSTFFANTFFEVNKDQEAIIAISRKYPIKIWLDGDLIFDNDEYIKYNWDSEKIVIQLKKGNHRLLIKHSESDYFTGISNTYNNSIQEYGYEESSSSYYTSKKVVDKIRPYYNSDLVIRITDKNGNILPLSSSNQHTTYSPASYNEKIIDKESIQYFTEEIKKDTSNWFNYYMLSNSYFDYGNTKDIEAFFAEELKTKKAAFFKFIMFQLYNINGKKEKGFIVLNGVDHTKTPIYSVLEKELSEIDPTNQSEAYETALKRLLDITPSNKTAIRALLEFYNDQGRVQDRIDYASALIKKIPVYEYWLDNYTKQDFKPNDYDIGKEEVKRNPKKEFKEAKRNLQKEFNAYNYEALIKKYKSREKEEKVLELYTEYLSINNWSTSKRKDKAKYLFNLERYDEALKELNTILTITPYDDDIYELIGDIYNDQKKDSLALINYKIAKHLGGSASSRYFYGGGSLKDKIAQIEGQKELRKKFKQFEFEDWMKDDSWKEKYNDEESVILGYTSDVHLETNGTAHKYSKMLIKILTEAGAVSWTEYNFSRIGSIQYIKVIKPNGVELFPDLNSSFVVFKNLEPGDLILFETEDSYTPTTELGNNLYDFQYLIFHAPLNFVKLEVAIPKEQKLNYLLHKVEDQVKVETKEDFTHYTWTYHNLPKMVQEEAVLDMFDTFSHVQYNTMNDWSDVVEWYQAKTYRKLELNYELENILDSIIIEPMTDKEKVIAIYNYITKEITYSNTRLLQSGYIPKNTELTCSGQIGDCKDVATLMISLLRSQGLEAYYVLVKTNSMFHMQTLPSLYFDHVIAGVLLDGKMEYYDLTTDFYPYYVTNENDMNAWALLIKPGENQLFRLPNDFINKEKNLVKHVIEAKVNLDKSIDIEVVSQFHGMRGGHIRETYFNKPKADMENEILEMLGKGVFKNIILQDYKFENPKEITAPFNATYKFKAKKHADNVLDIYFLTIPYMTGIETNTAILTENRRNTLNLHEVTKIEPTMQEVNISFPKGMKLYKLPNNIHEESEWGIYDVKFSKTKTGVKITKFQQFNVDEVPVKKFGSFKEFYLTLLEHDKTKIVFNGK